MANCRSACSLVYCLPNYCLETAHRTPRHPEEARGAFVCFSAFADRYHCCRTAVQACSVLVPLFGLQWLVTFYRQTYSMQNRNNARCKFKSNIPGSILEVATFWQLTNTPMFSSTLYKALLCLSPSATEMERLDSVVLFELLQMSLLRILSHSHL